MSMDRASRADRKLFFVIFFLFCIGGGTFSHVFALNENLLPEQMEILKFTASKKTLELSRGSLDGIKVGDTARFFAGATFEDPQNKIVGVGQVVKVYPKYSIWYFKNLQEKAAIKNEGVLKYFLIDSVLEGRVQDPTKLVRRRVRIGQEKKENEFLKERKNYRELASDQNLKERPKKKSLEEIWDLGVWKPRKKREIAAKEIAESSDDFKDLKDLYMGDIQKEVTENELLEKKSVLEFENVVDSYLEKLNEEDFSIKKLYHQQARDKDIRSYAARNTDKTVFEQYVESKRLTKKKNLELVAKIKALGPLWSEKLTEEELNELIQENAIEIEQKRQLQASVFFPYHDYWMQGDLNLTAHGSKETSVNQRSQTYAVSVGYEYLLIEKFHQFKNYTVDFSGRFAIDNVDLNGRNGKYTEMSLKIGLNWYPWRLPSTVHRIVPFVGLGARLGNATINAITTDDNFKDGQYTLTSIPVAQAGIKYRFVTRWTVKGVITASNISLKSRSKELASSHPDTLSFYDVKFGLGIGYDI